MTITAEGLLGVCGRSKRPEKISRHQLYPVFLDTFQVLKKISASAVRMVSDGQKTSEKKLSGQP
jgi:hypothetical protein